MKEMKTKIHVLRTGEVRVSPYLPFGHESLTHFSCHQVGVQKLRPEQCTEIFPLMKW